MLTEKQVRLLESVAIASENVPDEKFDMCAWLCGTTGCLIGNWLANGPKINGEKLLQLTKGKTSYPVVYVGNVQKFRMSLALQDFFDLDNNVINHLFLWNFEEEELPTRQQAITRLRNFIRTGGDINAALAMEE